MKGIFMDGQHPVRRHFRPVLALVLLPQIITVMALAGMTAGCGTAGRSMGKADRTALEEAPEEILNEKQQEANAETFYKIWQTVNETFWDPEFGGTDWNEVRENYAPLVKGADTQSEARRFMREALEQLGESHFYVIPAELYEDMNSTPRGSGNCGFHLRVIDGQTVVVKVIPDSPAGKAGIRCGWELLKAGDSELRSFVEKLEAEYGDSPTLSSNLSNAVRGKVRGEVGDELELCFLDGEGKKQVMRLVLSEPAGHKTVFSNLPPAWVDIRAERLQGDIGYISLNIFMDPTYTIGEFSKALAGFMDCRGVILDLRGNGGGIAGLAPGLAGFFVQEKKRSLGEMVTRDSHVNLLVRPRLNGYTGPLAILVDDLSASTSEFLAAGLQDLGRARIFGSRSAGAALVANMIRLPNGDGFEYAFADYESVGGLRIEGKGITPDEDIPYSREALLRGEDMALAAAMTWIREAK